MDVILCDVLDSVYVLLRLRGVSIDFVSIPGSHMDAHLHTCTFIRSVFAEYGKLEHNRMCDSVMQAVKSHLDKEQVPVIHTRQSYMHSFSRVIK